MSDLLLNLNDIKERYLSNPEPKEVTETREFIENTFNGLEFEEKEHKYFLPKSDGTKIELTSVSALIQEWVPYVDWDEKCELKALKLGIEPELLKREWHENNIISTHCGSKTHFYGENMMNMFIGREDRIKGTMPYQYTHEGYLIPYCKKEYAIMKYYKDVLDNPNVYPVMPETRIYTNINDKMKLSKPYAGTFDILMAYRMNGQIKYAIHDFKGLPIDTPILTVNGFKNMGDLNVGDYVYDKNGKPTKIINCSAVHNNPCMKIKFNDGYSIIADIEHRWEISFLKSSTKGVYKIENIIMTTQELYDYIKKLNNDKKRESYKIPKIYNCKPINNISLSELPIDPYVLGVWLGDGDSATGYVTNMYKEVFDEVRRRGYFVGNDVDKTNGCGKAEKRCIFGLSEKLRKLNLLYNKHIPDIFIVKSTFEQRLDLLRGIMDTDGYYNKVRNRYVVTTTKMNQVEFVTKILASLGIKPTVCKYIGICTNCAHISKFTGYSINFSTNIYPFLTRKIKVREVKRSNRNFRNVISVEKTDTVPTRCIEVDSPTHTYLADKMLLVTHNTNASLTSDYARKYKQMMIEPFGSLGLYEEAYSHYAIQLSLYSMGLMQLGIKPVDRVLIWLKDDGTYEKVRTPDLTDTLIKILK